MQQTIDASTAWPAQATGQKRVTKFARMHRTGLANETRLCGSAAALCSAAARPPTGCLTSLLAGDKAAGCAEACGLQASRRQEPRLSSIALKIFNADWPGRCLRRAFLSRDPIVKGNRGRVWCREVWGVPLGGKVVRSTRARAVPLPHFAGEFRFYRQVFCTCK